MDVLTILIGVITFALAFVYFHVTKRYGQLEKLPIPVVKPFLCFGSTPFALHKIRVFDFYNTYFEKFKTKTFGRYFGCSPVFITIDPEIVKEVCVKQADNFQKTTSLEVDDKYMSLDIAHGKMWKDLRTELSPTFTSGKLRGMMESMEEANENFLGYLEERVESGEGVDDFLKAYKGVSLDIVNACVFSVKTDCARDPNHEMLKLADELITQFACKSQGESCFLLLFMMFPEAGNMLPFFGKAYHRLIDMVKSIMQTREEGNIERNDFVQRLLELRKKSRAGLCEDGINDDNIYAQAVTFYLAGTETTARSLASLMHVFAFYPDVQEKVLEETRETEDAHSDMPYLEAVLNENLRMYPPGSTHQRVCTTSTTVCGFDIKKDTLMDFPAYASHYDPDFFPEPRKFRPERFLKENADELIPFTFRPFGAGTRLCIGNRFSLIQQKMLIRMLLKKFEVKPSKESSDKLMSGDLFFVTFEKYKYELVKRE